MWTAVHRWALVLAALAPVSGAFAAAPDVRALIAHIFERPEELPELRLLSLELGETRAVIALEVPARYPLSDLPPVVENRFELAVGALAAHRPEIAAIDLLVAHPGGRPLPPPRSARGPRPPRRVEHVVPDPALFPHGQALKGKTIAISPGHGYIYYDNLARYSTQRGRVAWEGCGDCRGIVEDFETHEIVVRQLIPLLEGAGARVVLVRERSYAGEGEIQDNAAMAYTEPSGTFGDGVSEGGWGGGYRSSLDPGASASFTVSAPASGPQLLSIWFVAGSNRWPDARLDVIGAFGTQSFIADFTSHGRRWAPIGMFDLDLGKTLEVRLTAPSAGTGALIADAVRLGAGTHSSNHPWWQMGAQPFAAFQEAPSSVTAYGDVTIRPRYAEFYGADVYVALHSNASGAERSTASGLSSYRYNCGSFPDHSTDPPAADCDDPAGSDRLQALIHAGMVRAIRADWDPAFNDRGPKVANFGELRELDGIPGVLIESAFHDQVALASGSQLRVTDNQSLHDPRWRRAAAWGIYDGLSEFFGAAARLAPAPEWVAARRSGADSVTIDFAPVPGALSYRVYAARGDRTFDRGTVVSAPPAVIDGLSPGTVVFARVASLNEAGEGLSSPVVTARASTRRAQVLVVDAFQREDAWIQDVDNRHDTLMTHGLALASREVAFDSASEAAGVDLTGYDAVVFALGAESTEHGVLSAALRADVSAFAAGGGAVLMSGSEIGWALDARGDTESRDFLATVFSAAYERDDAAAGGVRAVPGGIFTLASGSAALDDGTMGALRARSSDVLAPAMNGTVELLYGDTQDAAAVRQGKNVVVGVALDSIVDPGARAELVGAWVDHAITLAPPEMGPDAGVAPDAAPAPDAATPGADAALAPDADTAVPDGGVTAKIDGEDEGCGCASVHRAGRGGVLALLMPLLLHVLRRRR